MAAKAPRIRVDIDASLSRLAYRCYPNGCPAERTCCIGLAVTVSRREIRAIDSIMDEVARLIPALREKDGYADVYSDDGLGPLIEPRDDRGACPFLFRKQGHSLCAIHHVALQTGRAVASVKPSACRHWPLVLEAHGRRLRITVHPDAETIGCVAPRRQLPGQPSMREAFAAEIEEIRRLVRRG
jgi:Fe-S-cluster containining protein